MSTESAAAAASPRPASPVPRDKPPRPDSPAGDPFAELLADVEPLGRQALSLIYADGLTQRQAAQRLGARYQTVARVVAAAMRSICADLEAKTGAGA